MKNLFVGIDLSLNSTGVSFITDTGITKYLSILNRWVFTQSEKKSYADIISDSMLLTGLQNVDNLVMVMIDRKPLTDVKKIGLSPWARLHTRNCIIYSNLIAEKIEEIIADYFPDYAVHIGIENYSLGSFSKGTNTVQIIEITSLVKARLLEKDMRRIENFILIPGPTLKMFAGGGAFDKYMMLKAYMDNNKYEKDELHFFSVHNHVLCFTPKSKPKKKIIKANKKLGIEKRIEKVYVIENEVHSPISDLIDSWWVAEHVKHLYKTSALKAK